MKIAVVFGIFVLTCVAQIRADDAATGDIGDGSLSVTVGDVSTNGLITQNSTPDEPLDVEATTKKINVLIVETEKSLKTTVGDAEVTAEKSLEKCKASASTIVKSTTVDVQKILVKVDVELAKIQKTAAKSGVKDSVAGCTKKAESLKESAVALIVNTQTCVSKNVKKAKVVVSKINEVVNEASNSVVVYQKQAKKCIATICDVTGQSNYVCVYEVTTKADTIVNKWLPSAKEDISKLQVELVSVEKSLQLCESTSSVKSLQVKSEQVLQEAESCVKEVIKKKKGSKSNKSNESSSSGESSDSDGTNESNDSSDSSSSSSSSESSD